jgi:hypothetical protein
VNRANIATIVRKCLISLNFQTKALDRQESHASARDAHGMLTTLR